MLADPYYDRRSRYTVPYTSTFTGIGWRTDMVSDGHGGHGQPVGGLLGPRVQGHQRASTTTTGSLGSGCTGAASPTSTATSPRDLAASRDNLLELTDLVDIRYTIDGAYAKLPEGIFGIHHAWSGDMVHATLLHAQRRRPRRCCATCGPRRRAGGAGGYVGNDSLAVLKGAEHPVLAHMFLNYMLDDKVAVKNFGWNAYQPPINALKPNTLVSDGTDTREPGVDGHRAGRLRDGPDTAAAYARAGRAVARGVVSGAAGRIGP